MNIKSLILSQMRKYFNLDKNVALIELVKPMMPIKKQFSNKNKLF